jgi:hypothetical protein
MDHYCVVKNPYGKPNAPETLSWTMALCMILKIVVMLNISNNKIKLPSLARFSTVKNLENRPHYKILNKIAGFPLLG